MKTSGSHGTANQFGMTLIEILVAIMIIGLAITAFLPLQVIIARSIKMNQARTIANQEIDSQVEELLSYATRKLLPGETGLATSVTGFDYDQGDLKIGSLTLPDAPPYYYEKNGIRYTVQRIIRWVDDPVDGTFGDPANNDPIPFDYKSVEIIVNATGAFPGTITKTITTKIAREGSEVPYSGVIVQVENGWQNTGSTQPEPVPGALVTVIPVAGGTSYTGVSDEHGQAIIAVNIPNDSGGIKYIIQTIKAGMIMHPQPMNKNEVTLNPLETGTIKVQMAQPCSITLKFNNSYLGGKVTLDDNGLLPDAYIKEITLAAGTPSAQFTGLWPVGGLIGGTYVIHAEAMAWKEDFDNNGGFITKSDSYAEIIPGAIPGETYTKYHQNRWQYQSVDQRWDAKDGNNPVIPPVSPPDVLEYFDKSRLVTPEINLYPYRGSSDPDRMLIDSASDQGVQLSWQPSLNPGAFADNSFGLVYKGAGVAPEDAGGWLPLLTYGDSLTDPMHLDSSSDMVSNFRLRFDASKDMTNLSIDSLAIKCYYIGSKSFTQSGQNLVITVCD